MRELTRKRVSFAEALLSATADEVQRLITKAKEGAESLGKPVALWLSDRQDAFVTGIAAEFPGVPHRYCENHFLRDVAKLMLEADSHTKVQMRKKVRGLRKIERILRALVPPEPPLSLTHGRSPSAVSPDILSGSGRASSASPDSRGRAGRAACADDRGWPPGAKVVVFQGITRARALDLPRNSPFQHALSRVCGAAAWPVNRRAADHERVPTSRSYGCQRLHDGIFFYVSLLQARKRLEPTVSPNHEKFRARFLRKRAYCI